MSKVKLLIFVPGPSYYLEYNLKQRLRYLSNDFEGELFTTSSKKNELIIGNFKINAIEYKKNDRFKTIKYIAKCLIYIFKRREYNFDLVITYDPLKTGIVGLIASYVFNAGFIPEVNGDYTSEFNYFDGQRPYLGKIKRFFFLKIESIVLNKANGIKVLYPTQLDFFVKIKNSKHIEIIPDISDYEHFQNLGEEKIILVVGFPFYLKGIDIVIAAFKKISHKYQDWKLKILGHYPDDTELKKHINNHPRIIHHPAVRPWDLPEHIGKCSIFVLPSRTEAMGRVLLESMAAGKPRIGSNTGGIPTVINHNVDGFLFENENIDQLAEYLDLLINNPNLRKRLGDAGQRRIRDEFSMDIYYKKTRNFYFSVLNSQ